jgi:hypothetical protein
MRHYHSRRFFHLQKNKRGFRKIQNNGYETKEKFSVFGYPNGTRRMQELGEKLETIPVETVK